MEIFKTVLIFLGPIIGGIISYYVAIRGNEKRIELEGRIKEKETVLGTLQLLSTDSFTLKVLNTLYKKNKKFSKFEKTLVYDAYVKLENSFNLLYDNPKRYLFFQTDSESAFWKSIANLKTCFMWDVGKGVNEFSVADLRDLRIDKFQKIVDKVNDEFAEKYRYLDDKRNGLNLREGFKRLTIVLSGVVGLVSLFFAQRIAWILYDYRISAYLNATELARYYKAGIIPWHPPLWMTIISYPLAFMLGVAFAWIIYLFSYAVYVFIQHPISRIVDFIIDGFRAENG